MALAAFVRSAVKIQVCSKIAPLARYSTAGYPKASLLYVGNVPAQKKSMSKFESDVSLASITRNFSTTQPKMSAHGDHTMIWKIEKLLSVALLGILPAGIAFPSPATDALMAVAVVAHLHWGLEATVIDYVRPIIFGDTIPKLSLIALFIFSATILGGLLYGIHNGNSIGENIQLLWSIGKTKPEDSESTEGAQPAGPKK